MILALVALNCSSLTVRLDMIVPSLEVYAGYTPGTGFPLLHCWLSDRCMGPIVVTKKRAGLPRLARWRVLLGTDQGARGVRTPASARCRPHGSRRSTG